MGQAQQTGTASTASAELFRSEDYFRLDERQDPHFGLVCVLQNKANSSLHCALNKTYASNREFEAAREVGYARQTLLSPHLLRLFRMAFSISQSLCASQFKISYLYEYCYRDLR